MLYSQSEELYTKTIHEQEQPIQYEHDKNVMNSFHLDHNFNKENEDLNKNSNGKSENLKEQYISGKDSNVSGEFGSNDSSPLNNSIKENITNALSLLNTNLENEKHDLTEGEPTNLDSFRKDGEINQVINDLIGKCISDTADKCISATPSTSEKLCQTDISSFERNSCKRMLEFDDCGYIKKSKLPYKTDAKDELSKYNFSNLRGEELSATIEEILGINGEEFSIMNNKDILWSPILPHPGSSGMPLINHEEEKVPDETSDDKTLFDEEELEDGYLNWSNTTSDCEIVELDQLVPLPQEEPKSDKIEGHISCLTTPKKPLLRVGLSKTARLKSLHSKMKQSCRSLKNYPVSKDEIGLSFFGNNQDSLMASTTSNNNTPLKYSSIKGYSPITTTWSSNKLPEENLNHDCMQTSTSSDNNIASEHRPSLDYMLASTSSCNNNTPNLNYRKYLDYLVISRSLYYYSSDESSD